MHRWLLVCSVLLSNFTHARSDSPTDLHSFANPKVARVVHLDLDLTVDFERKTLQGTSTLKLDRSEPAQAQELVLDSRDLRIEKAWTSNDGTKWTETTYRLGKPVATLGRPLTLKLPANAHYARVRYSTDPRASGLQWLDREQTADKRSPFLYTQSQAIHARSWIPLQDSPGIRMTYDATIRTPKNVRAVMSAFNDPKADLDGLYTFEMKQPIPAYLIALAVGNLTFESVGPRTGVYAEPSVVERAAKEFSDMEAMMKATEAMYGPYRWGRYDVLVLPPSFPFGGMENPRLTFATPTILAGDKSLMALIAHELAHSWSGNLVSNATWRDFWLNEGFTVYIERRITEKVYGKSRAAMESVLGRRDLEQNLRELEPRDQILHVDLAGRDPDDGFTDVPYEKGALFLTHIERTVGRERFDKFLRGYFDHFAFQSITTADFVSYLDVHLIQGDESLAKKLSVKEWLYEPGLPTTAPQASAELLTKVAQQGKAWLANKIPLEEVRTAGWSTHEWLYFLRMLPKDLPREKMVALDKKFDLTHSTNSEILFVWLLQSVKSKYEPAYPRIESFLTSVGRRKFLEPLYRALVQTPEGKKRARRIYAKARPMYHPIAAASLDAFVNEPESPKPDRVFLLIGQSNMAGRAHLEPGDEKPIPGVFLFDAQGKWEPAANPFNRYASNRKVLSMQRIGPGPGFVATLRKANPDTTIGIVANARGGTKIEQWAKGQALYDNTIKRLRTLPEGTKLAGVLWHQGEGNSKDKQYLEKLTQLVANLRKDIGQPELPFLAGQIAATAPVNDQIAALPKKVPNTAFVRVDGLKLFDGVHFDRLGQLELGKRYAEAWLKLTEK